MADVVRWELDPDRSRVWIDGSSTLHPIRARASGLTGWFEATLASDGSIDGPVDGAVTIDVDRLRSGNPVVDRETRRRIDARRHPTIEGRLTGGTLVGPDRVEATGSIDLRGESVEVEGVLRLEVDGDELHLDGEQAFDVRDWGLQPPALLALRVHPEVRVRVALVAARA